MAKGEKMKEYIIAKELKTGKIIILTLNKYLQYLPGIYEPLDSANTKKEAEKIYRHLEDIGVQAYFEEIVKERQQGEKGG